MHLFAGTYERFLFGFKLPEPGGKGQQEVVRQYTYAAHQHPVKCVAAGGYFIASGGADDQIHLYDMKHGKDLGFLMNPGDGAVPCLQFYCPPGAGGAPSHMFSGSADGSIAVWRVGAGWEHLKLMKGHKGSVNSITLHPSGRLALSVAHDRMLRMWDLAKGNSNYTARLEAEGELVAFTPDGDSYLLVAGAQATVHSVLGEGAVAARLEAPRRITALSQLTDQLVLAALEDGSIKVWDLRAKAVQQSVERAHATRIRGLTHYNSAGTWGAASTHVASAASDGVVKLWDIRTFSSGSSSNQPAACLAETATQARITCIAAVNPQAPGPKAPPAVQPAAAAAVSAAAAGKAGAAQKQAASGKKQQGVTAAPPQATGKPAGKGSEGKQHVGKAGKAMVAKAAQKQSPGFEIVSEAQLAARQEKRRRQQQLAGGDDSGDEADDMPGALDPHKAAKATVHVKVKGQKPKSPRAGLRDKAHAGAGGKPAKKKHKKA